MRLAALRNLPLSIKISALTLFAILTMSILANIFIKNKTIHENMQFFVASSEQCLDSIRDDLAAGNVSAACELMQKANERDLTSFFIIQMDGVPVCYAPANQVDAYNLHYRQYDKIVHDPVGNFDYKTIKMNKFTATAGWLNESRANFVKFFIMKLPTVLLGIFISVIAVAIIVFRETKAIKKLLTVFKRSEKVSKYLNENKNSFLGQASEVRQLWKSAYELERTTDLLKNEVLFVSQDAQNFLRREITQRNEKIPYRFFSSMLRFDMNNYTKTFLVDAEATQTLILRLSIEADELVHRYGGLHYGFGGDEFIVLFRDSDKLNSKALSLACMRDIFLKVESIFNEKSTYGKVTIKASISHSENVLFKLPNGLFLRGLNLILSQRYLTTVAAKDANKVVVNKEDLGVLEPLCQFTSPQAVTLKGIQETFELCEQTEFTQLEALIKAKDFSQLTYFRSDANISRLFECLVSHEIVTADKMKMLDHLKSFEVCRADMALSRDFLSCFHALDKDLVANKNLISSLLIAAEKVIPMKNWSDEMSQALLNSNCKTDSRCNSSILRLLSLKASQEKFDDYADQVLANAKGPDFRSMGNFLIAKAKLALTDDLLQECARMLKSKNELEVATGIYVSSRIIQSQKQVDPVALSQFDIVPSLILRIEKLRNHQDLMIRSRAHIEFRELTQLENS